MNLTPYILSITLALFSAVAFGANEKVNLNTATIEELDALPHIGQYTAKKIIEMRPISDLDSLLSIKGMVRSEVEELRALVTLEDSSTSSGTAIETHPPVPAGITVIVAGAEVPVKRIGTGPMGVIFFAHSDSAAMNRYIAENLEWLGDLVPEKCSLFLWDYPENGRFGQVEATLASYRKGDLTARLPLEGIAATVIEQIREKSGLRQFLIIGNSLGAGIVLSDYGKLVGDSSLSFLLIFPTEAFMPDPATIAPLQRTTLLGVKGYENDGGRPIRTDIWLRGEDAWNWVAVNRNDTWGDLITQSRVSEPKDVRERGDGKTYTILKPTDFAAGHKTIGTEINGELLGKLIQVQLGWASPGILAQPPRQTDADR